MKRLMTALLLASVFVVPKLVHAEDIKRSHSDIVTFQNKASSDIALGVSSGGIVYNTEGLVSVCQDFNFLQAPSTNSVAEVVFASAGALTSHPTTFALTNPSLLVSAQPRWPSPIWPQLWLTVSGSTVIFHTTVTISGIDSLGSSRTVTVYVTTDNASTTGHAFVSISSVSVGVLNSTNVALNAGQLHLTLGTTNQIGLANDVLNAGDVISTVENNTNISSFTINAAYNTYQPTLPLVRTTTTTVNGAYVLGPLGNQHSICYRCKQSPPSRTRPDRP